ncbi:MAG: hypothetical protein ACLP5V_10750 [Candidatus Bathyarchaeia archaeon]
MSELDNQIVELTQLVNELEQKSAQTPIKPSDFNGIKKKTAEIEQYALTLERDVSRILGKLRENRIRIVTGVLTPDLVFEDKVYSPDFSKLVLNAFHVFNSKPKYKETKMNRWIRERGWIEPKEYDVMAAIYVLSQRKSSGAYIASLGRQLKGAMKKGLIGDIARNLDDRKYVREQQRSDAQPRTGAAPAYYYQLTKKGLRRLLNPSRTFSKDPAKHQAMEHERFIRSIEEGQEYIWIKPYRNDMDRSDAILVERQGSMDIIAVNIETPKDVKFGSTRRGKERLLRRMVAPFAFGATRLEIVCEDVDRPKLDRLQKELPKWLQKQIDI